MSNTNIVCEVCGAADTRVLGQAEYYTAHLPLQTDVVRCNRCGTWFRDFDPSTSEAITHFDVASYTSPTNEKGLRESRRDFFKYLRQLCGVDAAGGTNKPRILDVGCSYGHMLDIFAKGGYETHGVEIVDALRHDCGRRGHSMYRSINELPPGETFDVIALIDSLYCTNNPGDTLHYLNSSLKPDGVLILRVTNRTPFLEALRLLQRPIPSSMLGDSKYSFSHRGIELLCARSGYRIERTIVRERGKRIEFGLKALYYYISPVISQLLRHPITPGIILMCRKK